MKRAILLFAAASLMTSAGCYQRCHTDLTFYWHFPSGSSELSCAQAGVTNVQITVDGVPQGPPAGFPCTALAADGVTPVQGVTLLTFANRPYSIQIDALDANGHAVWTDAFTYTPSLCGNIPLDRNLTALTGTLDVSTTFDGNPNSTCATAGVEKYFIELVDSSNNPVAGANGVYVPCVDASGQLPGFIIPNLDFGATYTFRTLAATTFDAGVPVSNQRIVYQRCGASLNFNALTVSYQIDLLSSLASTTCP